MDLIFPKRIEWYGIFSLQVLKNLIKFTQCWTHTKHM